MCFDITAYNIGRLLVMIENRHGKSLLSLACSQWCGWKSVQTCVMVHHWVHHWLNQFHNYWLQNYKSQFHTASACIEVFLKLANLLQCKFLTLFRSLMMTNMNWYS